MIERPQAKKRYDKLVYLVLVFIFPVVFSTLMYYYHEHFTFKTSNHGTLVNPPLHVGNLNTQQEKKWQITYVMNGICDAKCEKTAYFLHQVQKALGKDSNRVGVVQLSQLQNLPPNKIYLVDPLGNLFMSYPSQVNPMDILKDIKHVLEVSQIG